jgi:hypothetical protein
LTAWELSDAPIRPSARKHGVVDEDIRHALRNWIRVADNDHDVVLYLGPDRAARLIEVGVRSDEEGVRIIHAMRPAREHRFELER